jgi:hypothetical protein
MGSARPSRWGNTVIDYHKGRTDYQETADRCSPTPSAETWLSMQVERVNSDALVGNQLPDGSKIILNPGNETAFALNATAGAAWDACSEPTTLARVTESMRCSLDAGTTEELAEEAILQLRDEKLVKTSGASSRATRRKFIATLGAAALPLVVSLTMADQRAHASNANSQGGGGNSQR